MKKSYKLSDSIIPGDKLSENIYKRKKNLYYNIKNFANLSSSSNDGTYAEDIIRIAFGGGDLNQINRNYAHFDVAITDEIEGVVKEDEIISIKSTADYKSIPNILKNTEAIKLNSVFSYILGAISNFNFLLDSKNFSSKKLINIGIEISKNYNDVDFEKIINVTLFYLIFHNDKNEINNYENDINKVSNNEIELTYGTYINYETKVKNEVDQLDSPISIGTVHINKSSTDLECIINKTNSIRLSTYWYELVKIWSEKKYHLKKEKSQYLIYGDIIKLFNLENSSFPIQIVINIGSYNPDIKDNLSNQDRFKDIKDVNKGKILKLKTASKLNDADFGKYNNEIVKTFNQMIDDLEENPSKILKYQEFINK